ncbi:PREDICTED: HEAT repeat-containing protein 1 [Acromyrmex echinatior]|uniref:HEAT repeat-containing protein 1 n=1 Tax=Acromyrmex echinatior TaxID=103372 RepID=F4WU42_ACREC|nr:PREDICTED: HEAT repeat-containing protein 1 [Acromyrmex echinatior]EGI62269.1 HEAT repeat-containing protein 1 [Acromyrmex echinatior]
MATSLAAQLKKLRTPQTNLLLQDKKRPSLLFDPKEAANLDRDTVLSIGQSGLEELQKLSSVFDEFQGTLFAQSSVNFERAVQNVTLNKQLDAEIAKFLLLSTPYFLLNACHKALEWLVFRYHIHHYNKEQFILLILPYHETRIFVRALQLIDLSNESDKWHWLVPMQKRGIPLSSAILVNRLISDKGFLKTLCTHVTFATKTYSDKASCLTTLYSFYTTAVLGMIELITITEVEVNYLLPTLLQGLRSPILDFAASSYMIIAKLITKAKLNDDTIEKLLLTTFKNTYMKQEATIFLLHLYQSQLIVIPQSLILQLSELPWFVTTIVATIQLGTNVSRFILHFLRAACQLISESSVQNMLSNMLEHIKLDDETADAILATLTCDFKDKVLSSEIKSFLVRFYQNFERSYPENFDRYLKKLMKQSESDEKSKQALHFLTSWSFGTKDTHESVEILNKLTHISAAQRVIALEILAKNNINVSENFRNMMTSTLQARFYDDDINVVKTLLSFSTKKLISLLPTDTLMDELLVLLSTCHTASRKVLAKSALKTLLELCDESDDTSVFITALPYLFPATDVDVEIAMEVLNSNFAKNNMYMQSVMQDINKSNLNAEAISSAAFHNILNHALLPPTENILNSMRQQISHGDAASLFFNMILLGSVCRVPVGSMPAKTARDVIEIATEMIKTYSHVKLLRNCNNITGNNIQMALKLTSEGILPLQAGTYVLEMVHRRLNIKSESKLDFDNNTERSNLILRLLEMFIEGMDNKSWRKHYSRCLQIFFQLHFATMRDLICFLAQFYAEPIKTKTSYHCLQISLLLLNQCKSVHWAFEDQDFVTNLLLSLARRNNECRRVAIDILKKITQTFSLNTEPFFVLLQKLATKSAEICSDPDELAFNFYFFLSPDPHVSHQIKEHKKLQQTQKLLFDMVTQQNEESKISLTQRSQLLDILVNVNSTEILQQLAPIGLQFVQKLVEDPKNRSAGSALRNILDRFTINTIDALKDDKVWLLFTTCIQIHESCAILENDNRTSPSIMVLKRIDILFDAMSHDVKVSILSKILDVMIDCEINNVVSVAGKTLRRLHVDATILISELKAMMSNQIQKEASSEIKSSEKKRKKRQSQTQLAHSAMIHSRAWKRGVILLEFVEHADNIKNEELLYSVLFDLLNVCLSLEEQSPIEYTNQLLLSTIFWMMKKKLPVRDADLQISLIVKCIRTSRNPQTHHHALLVLVEFLRNMNVHHALFNLMPIFTFMGSTMVRQDDAYSIQIISKTLETVVPIINATDNATHACELLRTFIVSLPHIPEHRRMPLFVKLLQLLDNHLHLYYLLTFESYVMKIASQKVEHPTQWLDFALQVSQEFPPYRLLQICTKVVQFIKLLPTDIEEEQGRREAMKFQYKNIYDVTKSTPKSLRHYKITAVQFLSNLLSSEDFINRVAVLNQDEIDNINKHCDHLAIELIMLIQIISKIADQHQNRPSAKYWKVLLHHLYDVLDLVNNLLPNTLFLQSIKNLLKHEILLVKKKALELLNARLLQKKFGEDAHEELLSLVKPLTDFFKVEVKIENQEQEIVQQTVLISLKLLTKLLAIDRPTVFRPILDITTELLESKNGPVLANAALCVAELCSSMRTHALYSLNKFVPAILKLLKTHCYQNVPDVIVISIVSALQKIVESLGNFLSLYLDQLLYELTMLNSQYTNTDHPKAGIVISRLKATTQKLSSCIPLRVLLPAVNGTYQLLLDKKSYICIPSLMSVLAESFDNVSPTELKVEVDNLANFFLQVLQFRERIENNMENDQQITLKDIVAVEESASKVLVALLLKLSEVTFRPFYDKLYGWAANDTQHKQRNITFYRLSANIAECLKSLFVLFAGLFLKHAASLLSSNNMFVTDTPQELTLPDESSRIELVEAILLTLYRVFSYDVHNVVVEDRYEILMQPIVDQVENTMGTREEYEIRASQLIVPCIASFASAISDDSLHKQLVYQTLLKTRHAKPYVRSTALNALVEIARKLGEDFMPLLPETVPFLAEMLEDEDEATEKCAQNAVRTLEEILGEPLQKYF